MAADEAITATADNLCANNLACGLSNAEGCTTHSNDTLITMVKTGNCLDYIQLYFTRLTSKLFDIYTCSKEYTRLLNYTVQLFNTRPILYSFHLLSVKLIATTKDNNFTLPDSVAI
jgi:hypothetical protein